MKTTFVEFDHRVEIILTPETPEEVAQLFRFSNNVKSEKPHVYMSFSQYNTGKNPYCRVQMMKKKPANQKNNISNS